MLIDTADYVLMIIVIIKKKNYTHIFINNTEKCDYS